MLQHVVLCWAIAAWMSVGIASVSAIEGKLLPATAPVADRLTVFGDSYSDSRPMFPFPKWSEQVLDRGHVRWLRSFARGGSTANDLGRDGNTEFTFRTQVDQFARNPGLRRDRDVMAIYFGQIDIARYNYPETADLGRAKADYKRHLDRLIALGATAGNRRVLLLLAPDRLFNRRDAAIMRQRTQQWNHWLTALAAGRRHVDIVDLFGAVDRVRANPRLYGLTNITTPDPLRHATTALFYDASHFGRRGHEIIGSVFARTLTTLATPSAARWPSAWRMVPDTGTQPDARPGEILAFSTAPENR